MINYDVSALILVCGEQQLYRCDNECAEISTVQTGQLSRCHTGNEYIVCLSRVKTKLWRRHFCFAVLKALDFLDLWNTINLNLAAGLNFSDVLRVPGYWKRFDSDCLDSGPLFLLFRVIWRRYSPSCNWGNFSFTV